MQQDAIENSTNGQDVCPTPCTTAELFLGLNCTRYVEAAFDRVPQVQLELDLVS